MKFVSKNRDESMLKIFFVCLVSFGIHASEIPYFNNISKSRNVTFLLSTTKSGTNLITGSLTALTRKPISWLSWGDSVLHPLSHWRSHPSYNRLELPLITIKPLLYRTHFGFSELREIQSDYNRLIFLTRNPKELIYRAFFLTSPTTNDPDQEFINSFLNRYLEAFDVYVSWFSDTKTIVFYEDFIKNGDEILLDLLQFMGEEPRFLEDFLENKQEYANRLLNSYRQQHKHNSGGLSAKEGPIDIYYSKNASSETLSSIDAFIEKRSPQAWEQYLKRFKTSAVHE